MRTIIVCGWCGERSEDRAEFASIQLTIDPVHERLHMCLSCCPDFVSDNVIPEDSDNDPEVATDGGHPPGHSPESSTSDRSAGADYYVVDEARPAVVDGPLPVARAKTLANEYGPDHIVASRDAIRLLESAGNTTVRWETDEDVDFVTDGGRRADWRRRDVDAPRGDAGVGDQTSGGCPHADGALPCWDCLTNGAGGDSR